MLELSAAGRVNCVITQDSFSLPTLHRLETWLHNPPANKVDEIKALLTYACDNWSTLPNQPGVKCATRVANLVVEAALPERKQHKIDPELSRMLLSRLNKFSIAEIRAWLLPEPEATTLRHANYRGLVRVASHFQKHSFDLEEAEQVLAEFACLAFPRRVLAFKPTKALLEHFDYFEFEFLAQIADAVAVSDSLRLIYLGRSLANARFTGDLSQLTGRFTDSIEIYNQLHHLISRGYSREITRC